MKRMRVQSKPNKQALPIPDGAPGSPERERWDREGPRAPAMTRAEFAAKVVAGAAARARTRRLVEAITAAAATGAAEALRQHLAIRKYNDRTVSSARARAARTPLDPNRLKSYGRVIAEQRKAKGEGQ